MYQKSKKGLLLLSLIVFTILCQTMVVNANAAAADKKITIKLINNSSGYKVWLRAKDLSKTHELGQTQWVLPGHSEVILFSNLKGLWENPIINSNEAEYFDLFYATKDQEIGFLGQGTLTHEFQVHGKDASTTLPFNEFNIKVVATPGYAPNFYDYTLTVEDKGSATGGYPATPGSQVK